MPDERIVVGAAQRIETHGIGLGSGAGQCKDNCQDDTARLGRAMGNAHETTPVVSQEGNKLRQPEFIDGSPFCQSFSEKPHENMLVMAKAAMYRERPQTLHP